MGALQYFLDPTHTALGSKVRKKLFFRDVSSVKLVGKTAVVTGANSGIGKATARNLALRGAEVHMLCRSEERGTAALEAIKSSLRDASGGAQDGGKVHLHLVDLSEPSQITKFAEDFRESPGKLDILVNNAAVMPNELRFNSRGVESALATNLVGFLGLTRELVPLLRESSDGRLVNVVSAGMFTAKLHLPSIELGLDEAKSREAEATYSGLSAYAQHHRGRVMLTDYMADLLRDSNVKVNSVHPGWVDTPGLAGAKDMDGFYKAMGRFLRTEDQGADTVVWLAVAPELRETGKYYFDRAPRKKHKCLSGTKSKKEDLEKLVQCCDRGFQKQ